MVKISLNKLGLTLGIFFAFMHLIWAVFVGINMAWAQMFVDWIMPLHFIDMLVNIMSFSFGSAILLVILAFIGGYIMGVVIGAIWNMLKIK